MIYHHHHKHHEALKSRWRRKKLLAHFAADRITDGVDTVKLPQWFGQGMIMQQLTVANQPVYFENVQNGLPGVWFDGVNDFMTLTNIFPVSFVSGVNKPFSLIVVLKSDLSALTEYQTIISAGNDTDSDPWINLRQKYSTTVWQSGRSDNLGNETLRSGGTVDTSAHVLTYQCTGSVSKLYEDGSSKDSGADSLANPLTLQRLCFGGLWSGGSIGNLYKGFILEIKFWYGTAGVDAEESKLMTKWGI